MDDKLYKFIRLIEAGTYTKAAEELHISQPALTVAIQKLESELRSDLVIRNGKQLELTDAGRAVYEAAQNHQAISQDLQESLERLARKRPSIVLGMIDSLADRFCTSAAFEELEQAADVTLIVNNSRFLREGVHRRSIAAALVIDDELQYQGVHSEVFGDEALRLVCHPDSLEQVQSGLEAGIIRDFISYDRPSTTHRHIQHFFQEQGIRVKTRLYSTSPAVMLSMALAKKGCAVLPAHICESYFKNKRLVGVLEPINRPIQIISSGQTELPKPLRQFLDTSKQLFGK